MNTDESPTGSNIYTTLLVGTGEEVQSFNSVHDNPNLKITSHLLDGLNYVRWTQSVKLYVGGHGKIGFLLRTEKEPALTDAKYAKWFSNDSMVRTWLINSMQPTISARYLFTNNAALIWDSLRKVYSPKENNARIFQLSNEIGNFKQAAEIYAKIVEKNRVFQFFAGLNSEFEYARVHLLDRSPFPTLEEAHSYCLSDQSRRMPMHHIPGSLSESSANAVRYGFPPSTPSQTPQITTPSLSLLPPASSNSRPRKKCDHCGKWGHLKATCHALHGRPPSYQPLSSQPTANFSAHSSMQDSSASSYLSQDEINKFRQLFSMTSTHTSTPAVSPKAFQLGSSSCTENIKRVYTQHHNQPPPQDCQASSISPDSSTAVNTSLLGIQPSPASPITVPTTVDLSMPCSVDDRPITVRKGKRNAGKPNRYSDTAACSITDYTSNHRLSPTYRQSSCHSTIGVDDAEQFREALDIVHVSKEDEESIFAMLAAVLWLGNVSSAVIDNESHVEAVADEGKNLPEYIAFVRDLAAWKFKGQFGIAFQLAILVIKLGCSNCENKLIINPKQAGHSKLALSTRKMRMGNDNIVQKLTLSQVRKLLHTNHKFLL
ncbi:hypothetical protein JRO89_XS15G0021100 [Xanthoceras sorbifolium]|uniref:Retrotransposon Copia-like N-terminal domain-containing protein n=1 Tax=Xanthoceras sorbifolium TaxID=99658 RepID=A0ABQ8H0S1_9ROSI|nr:hypothetical protein JRO89_XS15G0021100 [Xanthoceras sorbifolium]